MPGDPRSKKTFRLDLETVEMLPLVIWETDSNGAVLPGAAGGIFHRSSEGTAATEEERSVVDVLDTDPELKDAAQRALVGERKSFELRLGSRIFVVTTSPRREVGGHDHWVLRDRHRRLDRTPGAGDPVVAGRTDASSGRHGPRRRGDV